MFRPTLICAAFVVALMTFGAVVPGLLRAQDTPAEQAAQGSPFGAIDIAPGVFTQTLAAGLPGDAPDRRLALSRLTLMPGGVGPADLLPGMTVVYVETGLFGRTLLRGAAPLARIRR